MELVSSMTMWPNSEWDSVNSGWQRWCSGESREELVGLRSKSVVRIVVLSLNISIPLNILYVEVDTFTQSVYNIENLSAEQRRRSWSFTATMRDHFVFIY